MAVLIRHFVSAIVAGISCNDYIILILGCDTLDKAINKYFPCVAIFLLGCLYSDCVVLLSISPQKRGLL